MTSKTRPMTPLYEWGDTRSMVQIDNARANRHNSPTHWATVLSPPREPLVGSRGRPPTWWSPPPIYTTPADASFESQPDQRAAGSSRASRPRPEDATSTSSTPAHTIHQAVMAHTDVLERIGAR